MKKFLGAEVVFVSSEIPENVVIATPLNNIVGYYVDPGDSEFVKAGLSYTTDPNHSLHRLPCTGTYERAISDLYAIIGSALILRIPGRYRLYFRRWSR